MNKNYNSTLVRVAGNLLSGVPEDWMRTGKQRTWAIREAVATAREIIAEIERIESAQEKVATNE